MLLIFDFNGYFCYYNFNFFFVFYIFFKFLGAVILLSLFSDIGLLPYMVMASVQILMNIIVVFAKNMTERLNILSMDNQKAVKKKTTQQMWRKLIWLIFHSLRKDPIRLDSYISGIYRWS